MEVRAASRLGWALPAYSTSGGKAILVRRTDSELRPRSGSGADSADELGVLLLRAAEQIVTPAGPERSEAEGSRAWSRCSPSGPGSPRTRAITKENGLADDNEALLRRKP